MYLCILKLRTYGFVRMGFRDGKNSCNVPDLISKDNFKCQELSELTIPKGFLVSKCDVGNWIFSKSKEFFSEIAWKILGGFFGRKFLEGSFGRNFWEDFFGKNFWGGFFGKEFFGRNSYIVKVS